MLGLFSLKGAPCAAPPPNSVPGTAAGSCSHSTEKEEMCSSSAAQPGDFTSTFPDQTFPDQAAQPGGEKSKGHSIVLTGARARGTGRPAWAFQAGARQRMPVLASREPAAGHGIGGCVCCTKPQLMQQTLDELDFDRGLWGASSRGDFDRATELLNQRERDPNQCDLSGYTPLHYAARKGHVQLCSLLLRSKAEVDPLAGESAATPLHRACGASHIEVAKLLLGRRACPALQDADGENCLHKAARTGNAEIIEVLVDADKRLRKGREARGLVDGGNARDESCALKSACNNRGQTPLDLAEEVGGLADARIIQLLKD